MENKNLNRRHFLSAATAIGASLPLYAFSKDTAQHHNLLSMWENQKIHLDKGSETGVIVSTHPERGHYRTMDFKSDVEAVQTAYDEMMINPDLPKTLILDSSKRPFEFDGYLDIWQSKCRITATGGTTIVPKKDYKGPLIQSTIRKETEVGEDNLISNVIIDNIWLDGRNQSLGIKLRHIQESTFHSIHVRSTNGPALWLSDCVIENMFSNIILSDNCGSENEPALLIRPENIEITKQKRTGNLTANSTQFSGLLIHFPTNAAIHIDCGGHIKDLGKRQRKIQFVGSMLHGHPRQTKPLVTLSETQEISFVGTQMLTGSKDELTILQMGIEGELPVGNTLISHCFFYDYGSRNTTGIDVINIDLNAPILSVFGNSFGIRNGETGWLKHAVNWGKQKNKRASWQANLVGTNKEPHIGVMPVSADVLPF